MDEVQVKSEPPDEIQIQSTISSISSKVIQASIQIYIKNVISSYGIYSQYEEILYVMLSTMKQGDNRLSVYRFVCVFVSSLRITNQLLYLRLLLFKKCTEIQSFQCNLCHPLTKNYCSMLSAHCEQTCKFNQCCFMSL